ncbi:MAG: histidine phosphatase family protein [Balneolaceae bacterium]
MGRSRIFVIRHGETEYNRLGLMQGRGIDAPLNRTGRDQAEAVRRYLAGYPVTRIVTSSLLRTRQTAEPLTSHFQLEPGHYEGLDEMNFGEFEGKNRLEILDQMERAQERWKLGEVGWPIPGGESPAEVFERANRAVMSQLDEYPDETIVFVVHGRVIRILLSEWTGIGLRNMDQIEHSNGSINQLHWDGRSFSAVYLNRGDHLAEIIS